MEIKTYTNMWNVEKKLYNVGDIKLPFPIAFKALGLFVVFFVPWLGLFFFLGIPFTQQTHFFWWLPPAVLTWLGNKPIFEGKSIIQFARSMIGFAFRAKIYTAIEPKKPFVGRRHGVVAQYWSPTPRVQREEELE